MKNFLTRVLTMLMFLAVIVPYSANADMIESYMSEGYYFLKYANTDQEFAEKPEVYITDMYDVPAGFYDTDIYTFPERLNNNSYIVAGSSFKISELSGKRVINIPDTFKFLGLSDFRQMGWTNLETINLGSNIKYILGVKSSKINYVGPGNYPNSGLRVVPALGDIETLKEINVSPDNQTFSSVDGVLYDKAKTTLLYVPKGKTGKYIVPDSVTEIANSGFNGIYYCHNITELVLNDNVGVEFDRPLHMENLEKIYLGDKTYIPLNLLSACNNLKYVEIGKNNQYYNYATDDGILFSDDGKTLVFYPPGREGEYYVPESVTTLGGNAFVNSKLSDIYISDEVEKIEGGFRGCENDITIHSADWAYAKKYAEEHGIKWEEAKPEIAMEQDGDTVKVGLRLYTGYPYYSLNIAVYNNMGGLIRMITNSSVNTALDLSEIPGAYKVKAMLWKDNQNAEPLCEAAEIYVK